MYLLEIRYTWDSIEIGGLKGDDAPAGSTGFLMLFETREAAEAWREQTAFPHAGIVEVKVGASLPSPSTPHTLEERDHG